MTSRIRAGAWVLLGLAVLCSCQSLGKPPEIPVGALEWMGSAAVSRSEQSDRDNETDALDLEARALYVVHPRWEVGPTVSYGSREEDLNGVEFSDEERLGIGIMTLFNFRTEGVFLPYAGAAVGVSTIELDRGFVDDDDSALFWHAELGARAFLSPSAGLTISARYTKEDFGRDVGGELEEYGLFVGFHVFWPLSLKPSD